MSNNIKIDQKDLTRLRQKLNKLSLLDSKVLSNELGAAGLDIARIAKKKAPTMKSKSGGGTLMQSIRSEKQGKSVEVIAGAKYAPYVEFGTGGFVNFEDMLELGIPKSYAAQFKGKTDGFMKPQPFFFGSARIGLKKLLNRLEIQIKKAIK
jgi:HK97 gp10 family phage protein|tara:strand:- start:200 stop:652 length:453 start_codon:yes stop_codon:yes gene_type:complete